MRGIFVFCGLCLALVVGVSYTRAQVTEPPIGLPIYEPSDTPSYEASATVAAQSSVTAVATATSTIVVAESVDEAETGTEVVVLALLSVIAGTGFYFIKKYFDLENSSL